MGAARPRRRFSSVPRSLKPAPRNGPSSKSASQWCHAASASATVRSEPCRASSSPEKIAYSVSSVPAGSSATKPSMRPHLRRISEGSMFSAGAPSASPTARPSSAPRARSHPDPGAGKLVVSTASRPLSSGALRWHPCHVRGSATPVGGRRHPPDASHRRLGGHSAAHEETGLLAATSGGSSAPSGERPQLSTGARSGGSSRFPVSGGDGTAGDDPVLPQRPRHHLPTAPEGG
jgi:hypothetical protein